jgi:hypothetical protein
VRLVSIRRSGTYFSIFKPGWNDPLDPSYAMRNGGRWTPKGEFGALYLNATVAVAAANARAQHAGRAIGLFDLLPNKRPALLDVGVPDSSVTDIVSVEGISAAGLPREYPFRVAHATCWPIARAAYEDVNAAGIACRSSAECTSSWFAGEELALFDRSPRPSELRRRTFEEWYSEPHP